MDARRRERKLLDLLKMSRGDDKGAAATEMVDERNAESRAVNRVCSRPDLVQKDHCGNRSPLHDALDAENVRRKSAQLLRQRLVIANVGQ